MAAATGSVLVRAGVGGDLEMDWRKLSSQALDTLSLSQNIHSLNYHAVGGV